MNDLPAICALIDENPDDPQPRWVLSDLLEEQNNPRCETVRAHARWMMTRTKRDWRSYLVAVRRTSWFPLWMHDELEWMIFRESVHNNNPTCDTETARERWMQEFRPFHQINFFCSTKLINEIVAMVSAIPYHPDLPGLRRMRDRMRASNVNDWRIQTHSRHYLIEVQIHPESESWDDHQRWFVHLGQGVHLPGYFRSWSEGFVAGLAHRGRQKLFHGALLRRTLRDE